MRLWFLLVWLLAWGSITIESVYQDGAVGGLPGSAGCIDPNGAPCGQ